MHDDSTLVADVLLPLAVEGPYTYLVPAAMAVEPGAFVEVPVGPRSYIGVVWEVRPFKATNMKLRAIVQRFDNPPLTEKHRKFIEWLAAYYLENKGNVLRMVIRVPAVFGEVREKIAYVMKSPCPLWGGRSGLSVGDFEIDADIRSDPHPGPPHKGEGEKRQRITPQRQKVLDAARDGFAMTAGELSQAAGVGTSVIRGLVKQGLLEEVALPALKKFSAPEPQYFSKVLSADQRSAADELCAVVNGKQHKVMLLDGVTGSGKTEVYFEAIAAALTQGKQVLLLLPEIALTAGFLSRVEERFGVEPAGWHSDLRPRERERVWRGVSEGQAKIVVGARSALFLPWAHLGLIVVDEEHEGAYKQEEGVTYHARDMAVLYGSLGGFPVVLSSATPALESIVNVDRGRYGVVYLKDRHGRPELPPVDMLDMKVAQIEPGSWLSARMVADVASTLESGDQALLFLNRRGYAPLTLCRACGHRMHCPTCTTMLVEHRFRRQLMCHQCGHQEPVPQACPKCGEEGRLVPVGPGVERLAEEAQRRFPDARIAVLSSDVTRGITLREVLKAVMEGEYNLVIGTQLVAKGHHFPRLTYVGVVDADLALESSDPRAGERTWAMLAQVAGRAGRGEKPGRALVQTYVPDHPLMRALASGDRDSFFAQEKRVREQASLPPYGRLAAIIVSGGEAGETERFAKTLARLVPETADVTVLGPAQAPIAVVRGRHRWRFLVKTERNVDLQGFLRSWLSDVKPKGQLALQIDVDPYSFL